MAINEEPRNTVIDLLALAGVSELAVATTGVAYSSSFVLPNNCSFGLEVKFGSAGTVDVKIELEEGNEDVTTEGSADTDWAVGYSISAGITTTNNNMLAVAPVVAQRARIKFTGQGSNDASTVVSKLRMAFSINA